MLLIIVIITIVLCMYLVTLHCVVCSVKNSIFIYIVPYFFNIFAVSQRTVNDEKLAGVNFIGRFAILLKYGESANESVWWKKVW